MITRRSLADEIDTYDQSIADLNTGKKDCFDAYRDQLIAAGVAKPNIKREIEAVKAAIRRRRLVAKDADAFEEKDALTDEIFVEITAAARAPRARVEIIEQFDAETGEITEHEQPETARNEPEAAAEVAGDYLREPVAAEQGQIIREGDAPRKTRNGEARKSADPDTEFQAKASEDNGATGSANAEVPSDCMTGEVSRVDAGRTASATSEIMDVTAGETAPHSNPQPTSSPEADKTGEVVPPPASPVGLSDAEVPAFLRKDTRPDHRKRLPAELVPA